MFTMLYFAYGSNLDFDQMRGRCPSAQFVAIAQLPGYRLAFTRNSQKRGCGVADVVAESGQCVWGAVYNIAEKDFGRLDQHEGFIPGRPLSRNAYNREERHVWRGGNRDEPLLVWLYFASREDRPPPPSAAYMRQIVRGAKSWRLPADYLRMLQEISTFH